MPNTAPLFDRVALIGIGLIGSSMARAMTLHGLAGHIAISTRSTETLAIAERLKLGHSYSLDGATAAADADLVVICTPMGAQAAVARSLRDSLKPGAIVTDVGSVKSTTIRDIAPHLPQGVHLVPGHPIAGTENSGPAAGYADLFPGRWTILTPAPGTDDAAVQKVQQLWQGCGAKVKIMSPEHHDRVLAITSHLPHLIAYSIVDTADQLEDETKQEVITFSASGFRDFTRIAAGDPVMWRDVFLTNRDAVLEILGRFNEDLTALQRAIRTGDGDMLERTFARARGVRRSIIDAKQHTPDVQPVGDEAAKS